MFFSFLCFYISFLLTSSLSSFHLSFLLALIFPYFPFFLFFIPHFFLKQRQYLLMYFRTLLPTSSISYFWICFSPYFFVSVELFSLWVFVSLWVTSLRPYICLSIFLIFSEVFVENWLEIKTLVSKFFFFNTFKISFNCSIASSVAFKKFEANVILTPV